MISRSKYNSLESIPKNYTKEEWELAVSVIDFLPHNILVKLNDEYGVIFKGGNEDTDDETLVIGLFNHLDKGQIMEIVNKNKN